MKISQSTALAGYIGRATTLGIPSRSMSRIRRMIESTADHFSDIDRVIEFRAIETMAGDNISEVRVLTKRLDSSPVGEEISVVYRNGRFKQAKSTLNEQHGGTSTVERTLGAALARIANPFSLEEG